MGKKKNANTTYEIVRKIRGDWGNVNPVTKVIPNKKKNYDFDYEREYEIESTIDLDDWGDWSDSIDWSKYCDYFVEWCNGAKAFNSQEEADAYYKIWIEGFNYAREEFY